MKAKIKFTCVVQDAQDYHMVETSDDHMVSKLFLTW